MSLLFIIVFMLMIVENNQNTLTMADGYNNSAIVNVNKKMFTTIILHKQQEIKLDTVEIETLETQETGDTEPINENEISEQIEYSTNTQITFNQDIDIDYMARCVMAEAGGQGEIGIRLVIDIILNRADMYGCSTTEVINSPNQFAVVTNGSIYTVEPFNEIYVWILEECNNRYNNEVLYFRMNYYHSFGTPLFQWGDHYFSK